MGLDIKEANETGFYKDVLKKGHGSNGLSIVTHIINDEKNTVLFFNTMKEQIAQLQVIAPDGKLLYNQTKTIAAGISSLNVHVQHLPAGMYQLIVYVSDGEIIRKRFIK